MKELHAFLHLIVFKAIKLYVWLTCSTHMQLRPQMREFKLFKHLLLLFLLLAIFLMVEFIKNSAQKYERRLQKKV